MLHLLSYQAQFKNYILLTRQRNNKGLVSLPELHDIPLTSSRSFGSSEPCLRSQRTLLNGRARNAQHRVHPLRIAVAPGNSKMSDPIPDKAKVSIDFPDKFHMGSFGRESRLDVCADLDGVHIHLHRPCDEPVSVGSSNLPEPSANVDAGSLC